MTKWEFEGCQLWELLLFSTNHIKSQPSHAGKNCYHGSTYVGFPSTNSFQCDLKCSIWGTASIFRILIQCSAVVSQLIAPCWSYNCYPLALSKTAKGHPPPCAMSFPGVCQPAMFDYWIPSGNQTWHWKMDHLYPFISDFPIKTSIPRGFPLPPLITGGYDEPPPQQSMDLLPFALMLVLSGDVGQTPGGPSSEPRWMSGSHWDSPLMWGDLKLKAQSLPWF